MCTNAGLRFGFTVATFLVLAGDPPIVGSTLVTAGPPW